MIDLNTPHNAKHSQAGEDGILSALFATKGLERGYFCEFGAWDGQHLSNTFDLYMNGWSGCYIEGDASRFEDLKKNITNPGMALVHAFVALDGENRLDAILQRSIPAGIGLDLLSIDIDSDDLAVWKSVQGARPKVVIIEFNPTIPFDVRYQNSPGKNRGNSALSIWEFGISCGYEMVAATRTNLIFVDQAFNDGAFRTYQLHELNGNEWPRYFFGYDGTLMVADRGAAGVTAPEILRVPWSQSYFSQPLAKPFRRFDSDPMNVWTSRMTSMLSVFARRPLSALSKVRRGR